MFVLLIPPVFAAPRFGLEAGGFAGASYGIDKTRLMGGGHIGYSLSKTFIPFGELSYFPGVGRTRSVTGIPGAVQSFSIPLTDFNFGLRIRVVIPKSRIVPYGLISAGGIHSPQRDVTATFPNPVDASQVVTTPPFQVAASTNFTVSGGAGIRYYVTERLGFSAEFKAYKPSGTYNDPFYRVTGGFFCIVSKGSP